MKKHTRLIAWICAAALVLMGGTAALFLYVIPGQTNAGISQAPSSPGVELPDTIDDAGNNNQNDTVDPSCSPAQENASAVETGITDLPVTVFSKDPASMSEAEKMEDLDPDTRIPRMEFHSPVTLYVANAPGKPAQGVSHFDAGGFWERSLFHEIPLKPQISADIHAIAPSPSPQSTVFEDSKPIYTIGSRAAFIEQGAEDKRWFAFTLDTDEAARIVWQVARAPYTGLPEGWESPSGLIASGEAAPSAGEFQIDFKRVLTSGGGLKFLPAGTVQIQKTPFTVKGDTLKRPVKAARQQVLYVRAVAVDQSGNPIGDPGNGIEILYGAPSPYVSDTMTFRMKFDLLAAERQGSLSYGKEFANTLIETDERFYDAGSAVPWYFRPSGFSGKTDTILLQVALAPFKDDYTSWHNPAGLVYEDTLAKGTEGFDRLTDDYYAIPIDFTSFGPDVDTMDESILYYVRAVALQPGPSAGTVSSAFSGTVKMRYGPNISDVKYYPQEYVYADLPDITLERYQPIRWESYDWMYWYEIVRQPTYADLYNWVPEAMVPNADDPVPGWMPGMLLKFSPPEQEDKSWLEKAWDSVCDFFSSIADLVADLANWVSSAYGDMKAGLIHFVASNLPLVPDSLRDELEAALEAMVDYGLASMGIPPSLPNFDELSEMGADYLASVALEQAGIPATDITVDTVEELSGGIVASATGAAESGGSPNPLDWNFVRQYPEKLYRPAYVLLTVTNPHDEPTPPGVIHCRVSRWLTQEELYEGKKMTLSAKYGGTTYFELYYHTNQSVPSLLPGQTVQIPLYLQEYTGKAYSWCPLVVTQGDFNTMYSCFDTFDFDIDVGFDLLSPEQEAAKQGLPKDVIYEYGSTGRSFHFTIDPAEPYVP